MKIFLALSILVFAVALGLIIGTPSARGQRDKDDVTVVKRGAPVRSEDSEYLKQLRTEHDVPSREGLSFSDLIRRADAKGKGKEEIRILTYEAELPEDPDAPVVDAEAYLTRISCLADVVIIGSVQEKEAVMTSDERFIYTKYIFSTGTIIKNSLTGGPEPGKRIVVVRKGGVIELDGHRIRMEDHSTPHLKKEKSYLLFLKHLDKTGGYTSLNLDFEVVGEKLNSLQKQIPNELREGTGFDRAYVARALSPKGCAEVKK